MRRYLLTAALGLALVSLPGCKKKQEVTMPGPDAPTTSEGPREVGGGGRPPVRPKKDDTDKKDEKKDEKNEAAKDAPKDEKKGDEKKDEKK